MADFIRGKSKLFKISHGCVCRLRSKRVRKYKGANSNHNYRRRQKPNYAFSPNIGQSNRGQN